MEKSIALLGLGLVIVAVVSASEFGESKNLVNSPNFVSPNFQYQAQAVHQNSYTAPKTIGISSRDSYSDAAAESPSANFGIPTAQSHGQTHQHQGGEMEYGGQKFHYQIMPVQSYDQGYGVGQEEEEDDEGGLFGGSGLGGASSGIGGGIAGILGLKGLKKLKAVKAIKAVKAAGLFPPILFPLLLPLLLIFLPILLIPLILPALLLLFIPVPVVTIPSTGRTGGESKIGATARLAKDILTSEECVERISCEIGHFAHKYSAGRWVDMALEKSPVKSQIVKRISRAFQAKEPCGAFKCNPMAKLRRSFNF